MKNYLPMILLFVLPALLQAQIKVRYITEFDVNTIAYPNSAGNTTSSQPHKGQVQLTDGSAIQGKITFFKKKGVFERVKVNTGDEKKEIQASQISLITLDPLINERAYPNNFKNPEKNFQSGYIVLPTGVKLSGKVAQLRDFSDYDFFIYSVAFLPEGDGTVASYFKGGKLSEFGQEINGTLNVWDGYADGYLLRMVDGRFRLSRNPYSKTKNEFFTALKNQATDSLTKGAMQSALTRSLKDGNNLNESIENAANLGSGIQEALGSVEINKKEYLIFDKQSNNVIAVNKDNLRDLLGNLGSACGITPSKDQLSWDKIPDFVRLLNTRCPQ